jgi:MoaA/NifB/PqqE/SkfB family radical SAM enzyme
MEKLYAIKEFGNINDYSKQYIFELLINNNCDLKCSYCYMRNEDNNWTSIASIKNINTVLNILKKIDKHYPVKICLSGGEALLHPEIFEIFKLPSLSYFKNDLHINTNLNSSFDNFKKIFKLYKSFKFILHISLHPKEHNFQEFINKLIFLEENNIQYELNYMIDPSIKKEKHIYHIELLRKIVKLGKLFLKFIYINSRFKKYKNMNFTQDEIKKIYDLIDKEYYLINNSNEYIKLNDLDLIKHLPLNFKGYNCNYTFFTINCSNFQIKQMCPNFKINDIRRDYSFFIKYSKKIHKFKCPHDHCLWPSALDMKKVKNDL